MKTLSILIILILSSCSIGISQETTRWHIIKANGEQGFIDSLGKEIFTDRYDFLSDEYHNGLVFFRKSGKGGFLDENGRVTIFIDNPWGEFSEGLCCTNKDKQFYYINTKGEIALDLKNLEISKGKEISYCSNFYNGLAAVRIQNTGHKDVDFNGSDIVIDGNIYPGDWYYGFINKSGNWVVKPNLDDVSNFKNGISIIQKDGKFYFIDTLGKINTTVRYNNVIDYSEGFALVYGDSTCFFINRLGNKINDKKFQRAQPFSDGMAAVELEDRWGFIDTTGTLVIEPKYYLVDNYSEGLASVSLDISERGYFLGTYFIEGYIDKIGNINIPFEKNIDYGFRGFKNNISKGRQFIYSEDKRYTGFYELFYINKKGVKIWSEILKQ